MAPKTAPNTRRRLARAANVSRAVLGHWLLALTSHTLALVILLVVERYIHPTWCGR